MFKSFETERLLLRPIVESDIPAYDRHFVHYEIIRNLAASVPWPYPAGGVEDYVKNVILPKQGKDKWAWAICLKENPHELIGAVDLWRAGTPENRGFWLSRDHWGKGFMTEAVNPVIDYAFDELGFEKLIFSNAVKNTRSGRVKEKTGAKFIRTEPAKFVDPELTERNLYELSKDEWLRFKQAQHDR